MYDEDNRDAQVSAVSRISAALGLLLYLCTTLVVAAALIPYELYLLVARSARGLIPSSRKHEGCGPASVLVPLDVNDGL